MVVRLLDQETVDRMFQALADATRRDIVTRVLHSECSVSTLANNYAMSFAAVQKHVSVLERAGIVKKRRDGREQMVQANMDSLRAAAQVLDHYEALWRSRIDRFEKLLQQPVSNPTKKGKQA